MCQNKLYLRPQDSLTKGEIASLNINCDIHESINRSIVEIERFVRT